MLDWKLNVSFHYSGLNLGESKDQSIGLDFAVLRAVYTNKSSLYRTRKDKASDIGVITSSLLSHQLGNLVKSTKNLSFCPLKT